MKIIVDKDIPYIRGVLEPFAEVAYLDGRSITAADVAGASALVTRTRTRCDAALLEGSAVEIIATATIGYDHIDMDYCRDRGIEVATSAGCNARAVLQWVAAALRQLHFSGRISPGQSTIGVVGVGHVGSLVADYAAKWGFRVLCSDPPRERAGEANFVRLDYLARHSDVVTFHVPLSVSGPDATFGMASDGFFDILKPGAAVLNSSRGEVIDQRALLEAMRSGNCIAGIDTWVGEPEINRELASAAFVATPHIAGYSVEGKATATAMVVGDLARHFGWDMGGWFPSDGFRSAPREIDWAEMCENIPQYFDITALSGQLKDDPGSFENIRNNYVYRREFF